MLSDEGFSPGTPVFPSPQKPTLQIPIRSGSQRIDMFKRVHKNSSASWVNKLQLQNFLSPGCNCCRRNIYFLV